MFSRLEEVIHQEYDFSKDQVCKGTQPAPVQVNVKLPGNTTETLSTSSLATLQEIRNQVSDKLLAGEDNFHLLYDGLVLSSDLSCSIYLTKQQYRLSTQYREEVRAQQAQA